jgi:ABC-type antimicrobial peptide transport system permease subunit
MVRGIYRVTAYTVTQRTQEIGIRMALGAQRSDVLGLVVRQGMTLAAIGVVAGLAGAFSLTRVMASLLFNVRPDDPTTYLAISLLLIVHCEWLEKVRSMVAGQEGKNAFRGVWLQTR